MQDDFVQLIDSDGQFIDIIRCEMIFFTVEIYCQLIEGFGDEFFFHNEIFIPFRKFCTNSAGVVEIFQQF